MKKLMVLMMLLVSLSCFAGPIYDDDILYFNIQDNTNKFTEIGLDVYCKSYAYTLTKMTGRKISKEYVQRIIENVMCDRDFDNRYEDLPDVLIAIAYCSSNFNINYNTKSGKGIMCVNDNSIQYIKRNDFIHFNGDTRYANAIPQDTSVFKPPYSEELFKTQQGSPLHIVGQVLYLLLLYKVEMEYGIPDERDRLDKAIEYYAQINQADNPNRDAWVEKVKKTYKTTMTKIQKAGKMTPYDIWEREYKDK